MTTTTPAQPTPTTPTGSSVGVPWPSLLVLGGATFVMVTAEMLPTALLRPMSEGLATTEPRTAQLVSIWAAVVVLASFPLVALTRRFDRRDVIVAALLGLATSAALTAVAPSYPTAMGARLLGAAAVGLLWATVNAHLSSVVHEDRLGLAVSVVLGGATLGMVLGTPVGRMVADLTDWRFSFGLLALLGALAAALVRTVVPAGARTEADEGTPDAVAGRRPLAPMVWVAGLVALVLVGHYSAYTYITVLAEETARALPGGTGTLLLAFGITSAAGIAVAGRVGRRTLAGLTVSVLVTAVTIAALSAANAQPLLGLVVVLGWGLASGALPALAQTEILRRAGEERRTLAGALIPVLFNGGIAIGAALAALLASARGADALPLPAAAVVLVAGLALLRLRPAR